VGSLQFVGGGVQDLILCWRKGGMDWGCFGGLC